MKKMCHENVLELYAVRNKEGKWFRAKGFGGSGASWVDDICSAKIYPKIGSARGRVSYFANNYPQYGVPDLVKLIVTKIEVIDEAPRVNEQKKKREIQELKYREKKFMADYESAKQKLIQAQKDIKRYQK